MPEIAQIYEALYGDDLAAGVGCRHGTDFGKALQERALMFGDNLFWQGDTGFVIGGKAVRARLEVRAGRR